MNPHDDTPSPADNDETRYHHTGPFITAAQFTSRHHWQSSRRCRKGLRALPIKPDHSLAHHVFEHALREASAIHLWPATLTKAQILGYAIAASFTVGAFLFAFASAVFLWLPTEQVAGVSVNQLYAAGSCFFTTAGYLQWVESINGDITRQPRQRFRWWGFSHKNLGYWSCLTQFGGTIMFNVNTFDALRSGLTISQQNLWIWTPNMLGSILFLVSSYFAWLEQYHRFWAFNVRSWSGWMVFINALGAVFFQLSAFMAFYSTPALPEWIANASVFFTFSGAVCFLTAALMLPVEYASD
ncbi:Uncharacterised protein [BD1-7 clade bacterium]|uniref:YrhK domain-containing protein n=1 Tax=BD1-7 clade bacterium TaxID=2029982 RepID=A0A5S9Q811_9GAMM|nr:Uncharacterised protein [BD1-7 clade bacterium]CAA0114095.1 Uncharacterised protein [BD1-7 clade bacterium]